MKLTDRKKSPVGADFTDLIHIVKTGDTSQNSAGSSYKIEMGDYDELFKGLYVTGMTFNDSTYDLTISRVDGVSFTENLGVLATDIYITGGTYNPLNGTATFTNNTGGTFNVTGFYVQDNYQKTITGNYTLTNADNNYTILIDNSANPITITVPTGLLAKINIGFIQQGTGDVTFTGSGSTLRTPLAGAFKIKGQNYNAYLEQVGSSNVYQLLGNLKV